MLEIRSKFPVRPNAAYGVKVAAQLTLPFEKRQKTRLRVTLSSGEEAALLLPRGDVLRGGDLVVASDGRVVEVVAQVEQVLHVVCESPTALARAAYHLGNRHVAVQVGEGFLRLAADHVLVDMLQGLGATVTEIEAPFEPEAGAYGGHHHHEGDPTTPGARIHEYGAHEQSHEHARGHEHVHDEHCGHDHGHGHHHHHPHK